MDLDLDLLTALAGAHGTSGHEDRVREIVRAQLAPVVDRVEVDPLGNLTATRDGDHWVLNGTKMFITNGVHADLYFVAAKTGPGKREVSMFIVEKGTPGFSVGRALKKTGWLSSDTAELVFDNVRIPAAQLLGEEGKGF